jgi:hypothetical protein
MENYNLYIDWFTRDDVGPRSLDFGQFHHQALARAECDERLGVNRLSRNELQAVALANGCKDQLRFNRGKIVTNTQSRTTSEWDISIARPGGRAF